MTLVERILRCRDFPRDHNRFIVLLKVAVHCTLHVFSAFFSGVFFVSRKYAYVLFSQAVKVEKVIFQGLMCFARCIGDLGNSQETKSFYRLFRGGLVLPSESSRLESELLTILNEAWRKRCIVCTLDVGKTSFGAQLQSIKIVEKATTKSCEFYARFFEVP